MATFIVRFATPPPTTPPPIRVAVKDLIDMIGQPTTAGCRALAATAAPAAADATCLTGIRAAEARGEVTLVGKTGLHELAFGVSGVNPWYGTPTNPLDPSRIPGGSSSGSAVAVATDEADIALGSDTGGSIRIPAACCGVAGLKTTSGRIPTQGVRPLAPSLDTVGPMARDIAGLVTGMVLLDPTFVPGGVGPKSTLSRLRLPAHPTIDAAIDDALRATGLEVVDVDLPGWIPADGAATVILLAEAWVSDGHLLDRGLGRDVASRLREGARITPAQLAAARRVAVLWRGELEMVIRRFGPLVLPTLADETPRLADATRAGSIRYTLPVNLAGFPALSFPVPLRSPGAGLPASLQIIGLPNAEAELLRIGADIEAAVAT